MKRVRIYLGERDKPAGSHRPLWEVVLERLRDQGASGATAFRGLGGFGTHGRIHMGRLADVIPNLPVVIEWVDDAPRVERMLPSIAKLVREGTITVEDVDLARYAGEEELLSAEPDGEDAPT